jgi:hypothetical protein
VILHCDLALDCYSIYGTILATRAEAPSRHAATQ